MASASKSAKQLKRDRPVTAVRFPADLHDELREAADDRDLSVNFLVVKAVQEFLTRLIPADELRLTREPGDTADRPSAA